MTLILSNPTDQASEDLQLTDEHGALVVPSNTGTPEEDLLDVKQLQNFHWHHETYDGKTNIFVLVTIDGFILILFWVVQPGIWEVHEVFNLVLKTDVSLKVNHYSPIPAAPKAVFRTIDYMLNFKSNSSHQH